MIGIKCVAPAGDIVTALRGNGLLTVPAADNVVRLLPPLIIDQAHVAEAVAAIEKTCREYGA
jgi:acetylornithine/N-succinyldiaminopimelate aminotransferase